MRFLGNRQELEHTLILLHHEGNPIRELSRQFHLGRNAVRRILRAHAQRRDQGHELLTQRLKRASKLDGFEEQQGIERKVSDVDPAKGHSDYLQIVLMLITSPHHPPFSHHRWINVNHG